MNLDITKYIRPNERFAIAVSGGIDSVVLLDVIVRNTQYSIRNTPLVLHLNHKLRGKESDRDEVFVKKLARQYGLQVVSAKANVKAISKREKRSLEDAGREARLDFFRKAAKKYKFKKVFLAHHQDDLMETVLMRLFRGVGGRGLRGMSERTKRDGLILIRPLLGLSKKEIQSYAKKRKLKFREDASNQSDQYFRNKLRLKIIPYLEKELGQGVKQKLLGFRNRLSGMQNFVDIEVEKSFKKNWKRGKSSLQISQLSFQKLHPYLQYGTLSLAYQKLAGKILEQREWLHAHEVIEGKKAKINLRGNLFFGCKSGNFILTKSKF